MYVSLFTLRADVNHFQLQSFSFLLFKFIDSDKRHKHQDCQCDIHHRLLVAVNSIFILALIFDYYLIQISLKKLILLYKNQIFFPRSYYKIIF